jgi:hypothetical protein
MRHADYKIALALLLAGGLAACNWQSKAEHAFNDVNSQKQFFYRLQNASNYVPEPQLFDKLDLDDNAMLTRYAQDPILFQKKLDALHVDINTVLVKPDPAPIRILAIEEASPERLWRLFLLTGNDTAQLRPDGIHIRRQGFPEEIRGGQPANDNLQLYGEMGVNLWRRNPQGGWQLDQMGGNAVNSLSGNTTNTERKHKRVPLFHVDCDALRKFVQPLAAGESTRDMILKVNVPTTPEEQDWSQPICRVDLAADERRRR